MSSADAVVRAYRELAQLPGAGGRPLGDLALIALAWPYVVVRGGSAVPEWLAEAAGGLPAELARGGSTAVIVVRTHIAPLLDALGEQYEAVSRQPPALLWYPSERYERLVTEFAECAERLFEECDPNYQVAYIISLRIMASELARAERLRGT